MSKIIDRIEQRLGVSGMVRLLSDRLPPTDLQSLLLEVYRSLAARKRPADVLAGYAQDRFVRPSRVSPLRLLDWERAAFTSLPSYFEALEISPVAPLGTCSVIAGLDQNWSVATARNTEVVSDSTNVLALECATRRRALLHDDPKSSQSVHLAARHRLLRAQFYNTPNSYAHFAAFALVSAGRAAGPLTFELHTLGVHMRFYLAALRSFLGDAVPLRLSMTDFGPQPRDPLLTEALLTPIGAEYANTTVDVDDERTAGRGYYDDLCFHVHAMTTDGQVIELADGGVVPWSKKLLGNARERMVISGIGSERLCMLF